VTELEQNRPKPVDRERARAAIAEFLRALGVDPNADPELAATPARVADAWADDLVNGYLVDVRALLRAESSPIVGHGAQLVLLREVSISTVCPHHLLPARGTADIAYLPGRLAAGLGTIVRLVDAYAHRLTLQETIGENVSRALVDHLGARGAACRLRLQHGCLASRGERHPEAVVETIALAGTFVDQGADRDLLFAALAGRASPQAGSAPVPPAPEPSVEARP
jgi:GTP cyclohydrolase I